MFLRKQVKQFFKSKYYSTRPLEGIQIIDCSRVLAGPFATQLLGDLGANVIKIERPIVGDDTRHWKPPITEQGLSAYFLCANRNKQSVTIDMQKGAHLIQQLVAQSHVFIENFKVGSLAKYGLDYETLKKINPSLICKLMPN